jgi:hypothetical protein
MRIAFAAIACCVIGSASAPAAGQQPQALAAPSAEPRELDWNAEFPYAARLDEWDSVGELLENSTKVGHFFLHRRSIRTLSSENLPFPPYFKGPFYLADVLFFYNGEGTRDAGYRRLRVVLDCDENHGISMQAMAQVTVGPDQVLRPSGPVMESFGYQVSAETAGTVFETLCTDAELRAGHSDP